MNGACSCGSARGICPVHGIGDMTGINFSVTDGPLRDVLNRPEPTMKNRPEPTMNVTVLDGYRELACVLFLALDQAQSGKGHARHSIGQPFLEQPMMSINRMLDTNLGCLYQAVKKIEEATRLKPQLAEKELLGAINYLAGAILLLRRNGDAEDNRQGLHKG